MQDIFCFFFLFWNLHILHPTIISRTQEPSLCKSSNSCVIADLDGSFSSSPSCQVTEDSKFDSDDISDEALECLISNWDDKESFDEEDHLPFFIQMFRSGHHDTSVVGLDLRLHYIEFMTARFRIINLHHCANIFQEISPSCQPRCVKVVKTDKVTL